MGVVFLLFLFCTQVESIKHVYYSAGVVTSQEAGLRVLFLVLQTAGHAKSNKARTELTDLPIWPRFRVHL